MQRKYVNRFLAGFVFLAAVLVVFNAHAQTAGIEQRCNELGASCVCSEPFQSTSYTRVADYGVGASFLGDQTGPKKCHYEGVDTSIQAVYNSNIFDGALAISTDPTILNLLPNRNPTAVARFLRHGGNNTGDRQNSTYRSGYDAVPLGITVRRLAMRWYTYYSPTFNTARDGSGCTNSKFAVLHPTNLTFPEQIFQWYNNGVNAYGFVGSNWNWASHPSFDGWVSGHIPHAGNQFDFSTLRGKWLRVELIMRHPRLADSSSGSGFDWELWITNVTDKTAPVQVARMSAGCTGCMFINGAPLQDFIWDPSIYPIGNDMQMNTLWYHIADPGSGGFGVCDGWQGWLYEAVAKWDTDAGQMIGPAYEVEGTGGPTPPPTPPPFDFSLSNTGAKSVTQGSSITNTITDTLVSGTSQATSFTTTGYPTGATASYSPTSCTPTCATTLTISTSATTPTGTYTITTTGTGGGLSRTTSFTLTVNSPTTPPPPPPPASTKFNLNDRVQTTANLNVRSTPSTAGTLLGTQLTGALGTVIGGPTFADSFNWWNINYDTGADGWSVEDFLTKVAVTNTITTNLINGSTLTGSVTWTATPTGAPSRVEFSIDNILKWTEGAAPYQYNGDPTGLLDTTTLINGSHSLKVQSFYSDGTTAQLTITVTVSNGITPPPPPASTKFLLNDRVQVVIGALNVRTGVGTSFPLSSGTPNPQPVGAVGSVIGGPTFADGFNWWNINYDTGADGWSVEDYLVKYVAPPPPPPSGSITIGEPNILTISDSGNGNLLLAQQATLSQTATIQSMSFYVTTQAGNLRLGIYDATGPGGGPGQKKAETNSFIPIAGWNTQSVITSVSLSAGTYWLAYLPSDNLLGFRNEQTGLNKFYSIPFGTLPQTYSSTPTTGAFHFSLYATLNVSTADTTAPSVSVTAPLNGQTVQGTAVQVSANAQDPIVTGQTTSGIAGVQFKLNGLLFGTEKTVAPYSLLWDSTTGPNGTYSLTATARDNAGNQTTTAPVSVTVNNVVAPPPPPPPPTSDTIPPPVPGVLVITLSLTNSTGATYSISWPQSIDQPSNTAVPVYTWTAGYNDASAPQSGTTNTNTLTLVMPYHTSGLAQSAFFCVKAKDAAGNLSIDQSCNSFTVPAPVTTNTPPTVSPITANVADVDPNTAGIQYYEGTTVTYASSASDINNDPLSWTWYYTVNGGARTAFLSGTGAIQPAIFNYLIGTAPKTYQWILSVSDGKATTEQTLTVSIITRPPSTKFSLNDRVQTTASLNVRTSPTTAAPLSAGTPNPQPIGSLGTIIGGPTSADGFNWWNINYDLGADGWSVEDFLMKVVLDTTSPSEPANLTATAISTSQINLSWTASTDNVGVTNYRIYRCQGTTCAPILLTTIGNVTTYSNTGLLASTAYRYQVAALDIAGNVSTLSTCCASATTLAPADTTAPTVSITAPANSSTASGTITVSANATDNIGVVGVQFKLNGLIFGAEDTVAPYSFVWNTTLSANGTYSITAVARDNAGNQTTSAPVTVTVSNPLPPFPGLVLSYSFNTGAGTTLIDSSGNGKNGTIVGAVWTTGKYGKALDFNGTSNYVSIANPVLPTQDFTYEAWVNLDTVNDEAVLMSPNSGGGNEFLLQFSSTLRAYLDGSQRLASASAIPIKTWTHVAVTRLGSSIRIYFNGVQNGSTASYGTVLNFSTCPFFMGTDIDSGCTSGRSNFTDGRIDEVRVYNRALLQTEIQKDMITPIP